MSQKDEWVREENVINGDASQTWTQSSAAGCGTIASESAQVGLCVRLSWTVRGNYHRSTNDKSSFLAHLSPPPTHSRTTTFSSYPHQEYRLFTNFRSQKHMARTKVKIKYHLLSALQLLTDFLVIVSKLPASPPEVGNIAQLEFPYK